MASCPPRCASGMLYLEIFVAFWHRSSLWNSGALCRSSVNTPNPNPSILTCTDSGGLGCRGELGSLTEFTKGWEFVFPLEAKSEGNSLYFYKQEHWRCCTSWGEQFTSRSFKMWTHLQGSDTSVQINTHFSEQPKEMKLNTMQWNTAVTFRECSVIEQLKIKMGNQLFLKYL